MKCSTYLMSDETLFSNKGVFEFDYTPEHLNYRDTQMRGELAYQAKPGSVGAGGLVAVIVKLIGGGGLG